MLVNDQAAKSDIEKSIERWLPNRVEAGSSVLIYYSRPWSAQPNHPGRLLGSVMEIRLFWRLPGTH